MDINGILHFAPGIPFNDVDREGTKLPGQFRRRIEGFYLEPAECCIESGCAFAAGLLLVSCIDALARLKYRSTSVGERFRKYLRDEIRLENRLAQRLYDEVRNGLVHEACLKNGAQFTLDSKASETVTEMAGVLLVNPKHLLVQVRAAFDSYIKLVQTDEHERRLLSASLMLDLEKDFLTAQQ